MGFVVFAVMGLYLLISIGVNRGAGEEEVDALASLTCVGDSAFHHANADQQV